MQTPVIWTRRKEIRDQRIALGFCARCGNEPIAEHSKHSCVKCLEEGVAYARLCRERKKERFRIENKIPDGISERQFFAPQPTTKKCRVCKTYKPVDNFYWSNKEHTTLKSICKECDKERVTEWARTHPEARQTIERTRHLNRTYRMTDEDYAAMLEKQGGGCALCNKPAIEARYKRLCIDHAHDTLKIRGLLCSECNFGIGAFKDNIDVIKKAIQYLEDSRKEITC